ncbi:helix-turn-helix domain-containing protein [Woodsholea maritima]|uniref:helix-turn-helix domain-containing protein n=1 Tax=Woodsholea maritima TaxID=240237 RepID=UPI00037FD129|nr:helix-turn-helix domain-containing protein [Woodsholea maritima]
MNMIAPHQPRRVCALIPAQAHMFELSICAEIFGLDRREDVGRRLYEFSLVSAEPQVTCSITGIQLSGLKPLSTLDGADLILIPSWSRKGDTAPAILNALIRAHQRGAVVASICSGAFLLAEASLLKGRRATTHWKFLDDLTLADPRTRIEPNVLYVDEGDILTSAGSAAGLDLCLHLVRRDYGPDIANMIAQRLVLPAHREGGQAQYVPRPVSSRLDGDIAPILERIRTKLNEDWPVSRMAREAAMSERTFVRRFRETTAQSPLVWLIGERITYARDLLETKPFSVDVVAQRAGFGSSESFRVHFRRRLGVSPSTYRRSFSWKEPVQA